MQGSKKNFLFALSILIGTIVGAGIFGIPYVVSKSGIIPGFFYFLILGSMVALVHLFFGEIVLRTEERHRLPGFAQKYLGGWGKALITISTILGLTGALLAYIIIGGDFLKIVFSPLFSLAGEFSSFNFSLVLWVFLSFFVFRGIKSIAKAEFLMNIVFFFVIFIIVLIALPEINIKNFSLINTENIFLPYGVILFSFLAFPAIPVIREILKSENEKKNFKKIIIIGILTATILYILFSLAVVGVSGENTTPETFDGLLMFLGEKIVALGALFGILVVTTSYLVLGNYFKNTLYYDYKIPRMFSASIACGLPLILFLIGFREFISVIGFVGILVGTIEGIIIILIFKKAKTLGDRQPEYSLKIPSILLYFLILLLILGTISQIL
jgi:tyrosine-specific transport protein